MDLQMSSLQKQPPNGNFLGNKRKVRHVAEVIKSKCGYCGFSGYQGFENRNNRRNRRNCTLYSKNIPTDFQGERILTGISTDFL